MARNCHKAVYHAVYLMELQTEYLYPEQTEFGIQGSIAPEQVKRMLEQYPDTQAVLLTSPTYDGVVSDIAAIAEIVHAYQLQLMVDGTWRTFWLFRGISEKGDFLWRRSVH